MSYKKTLKKLGVMAVGCLAVAGVCSNSAIAQPYNHMSYSHCTVTNTLWGMTPGDEDDLTLPRAMYHANEGPASPHYACGDEIAIAVDEIAMKGPLTIRASGDQSGRFVLRGGCVSDAGENMNGWCDGNVFSGTTTLNAKAIPAGKYDCAVRIVANEGNYVWLRDLIIKDVPAGMAAICMEGDYALMTNVHINGSGGDGFVIGENGQGNIIEATAGLQSVDGRGVVIKNSAELSLNMIDPFDGNVGATGPGGLALLGPGATGTQDYFMIETTGKGAEDWITSGHPVQVRIIKKQYIPGANPTVIMQGFLAKGAEVDIDAEEGAAVSEDDLCNAESYKNASRIQIYETGGLGAGVTHVSGQFSDFIGEAMGFGLNPLTGFFQVNIPADAGTARFILVPEIKGGTLGRPSHVIYASNDQGDVDCKTREFNSEGFDEVLGPDGVTPKNLKFKGYKSKKECEDKRGITWGATPTPDLCAGEDGDTDGDGILDRIEDDDCNCDCNGNETCWWLFDTDNDGIPDGLSHENTAEDTDCDGVVNALDDDSDNDGKDDGIEDRNGRFFGKIGLTQTKGVLFRYQKSFSVIKPVLDLTKEDATPVSCELGSDNKKGVLYEWYVVTCKDSDCIAFSKNPTKLNEGYPDAELALGEYQQLEVLVCRNQSLGSASNFNGSYDSGNHETNAWDWDTDGDGICDGDNKNGGCGQEPSSVAGVCNPTPPGPGAYLPGMGIDNCPTFEDIGNTCVDAPRCFPDDVFWGVSYEYVEHSSADGSPTGFVLGDDGIPDVLQLGSREAILLKCFGHSDNDGIPDCVENPYAQCPDVNSSALKYYADDSDGDGFNDNVDVCPESLGAMDDFVEDRDYGDYSCEPTKGVYVNDPMKKVLAKFLDRDGDGLWDDQEDKDLNGEGFENPTNIAGAVTAELLATLETNPLSADSDGDGLSDKDEVKSPVKNVDGVDYFTNPRSHDTDHDTISDGDENLDGQVGFTLGEVIGAEDCSGAMTLDTDPTEKDTDGDGLSDKVELDGSMVVGQGFINEIANEEVWANLGGIDMVSNPRSADSDNDGLKDSAEYNGIIKYSGSNPCMRDSDNDNIDDVDEPVGCRLNPDPNCVGGEGYSGMDSDSDGLSDICENKFVNPADPLIHLDAKNQDSDGDGVKDGDEDINHNCIYEPNLNETNPFEQDTDGDGLKDGFELKYGTDPTNMDTDGDCLTDGMEDKNLNGQYDMGVETSALMTDTDNDGLPDGKTAATGLGEDFNCNGVRDMDGQGNWLETDPINPDSDNDGSNDGQEINGNMANIHRATTREGCMSIADTAAEGPSSMFYLFGLLMMAVKIAARRTKKTSA